MTHSEFISSESVRKRYWARSVFGIEFFSRARPNRGHFALAQLEKGGFVNSLITQNVDRLHQAAGSSKVLEIHGHGHGVSCLNCKTEFSRKLFTNDLKEKNAEFLEEVKRRDERRKAKKLMKVTLGEFDEDLEDVEVSKQRADGDAELGDSSTDFSRFEIIPCYACGGVLMPTIVFFGGFVPQEVKNKASELVEECDQILALGSTLQTFSCFRLVRDAKEQNKKVGIVNFGQTRADPIADFRIEANIGDLLTDVVKDR